MLKPPKKNFGILPTNETFAHLFIAVGLCLIPVLVTLGILVTGGEVSSHHITALIPRLFILGLYGWVVYAVGFRTLYGLSRRRRYIQRVLAPYFKRKYGVKMVTHGSKADAVFLKNDALNFKGRRTPEGVFVLGWEYVEAVAAGETLDAPLGEYIHAVQKQENGDALELPIRGADDSAREIFILQTGENDDSVPELGETEAGIKSMLGGIIQTLPPGEALIRCIAPSSSDMSVENEMGVLVDEDAVVRYSLKDMDSMVETLLFNVRLSDSALVICIVEATSGKKYICGHIVKNSGYSDVPPEQLRAISDDGAMSEFIFVKNAKEMQ